MRQFVVAAIKYVRPLYYVYFYVVSCFLKLCGILVRQNGKLVLLSSFGGKKYDDSPKAIYEKMCKDVRFKDFRFVWAFHNPDCFDVPGAAKVKTDSWEYFLTALRARIWITNSSLERGLSFKPKNTLYVNTWHGSTIKKMGSDIDARNTSFRSLGKMKVDIMTAQNEEQANIFSRVFEIPRENFLVCGLPRNDFLLSATPDYIDRIKEHLNLPKNKKIILYAPTFREFDRDSRGVILKPPIDLKKWETVLADEYVLLFRAHYEVAAVLGLATNEFCRDVTDYPELNDLLLVADLLISDYSSIVFDYALLEKPIFHYCYDYDRYESKRGMYRDIREYIDGSDKEDELLTMLKNMDWQSERVRIKCFKETFSLQDGHAADEVLAAIAKHLQIS
ncbi:CDP-glycerol glycerophosphotransferase family protein [Selenomonas montiformis]|uniref:CDP-glycerol glycerophosphotransferase family protein n=1 Tax=Selenomonas montiformis TaxID=2652285 RepID=UPI0039F529CA